MPASLAPEIAHKLREEIFSVVKKAPHPLSPQSTAKPGTALYPPAPLKGKAKVPAKGVEARTNKAKIKLGIREKAADVNAWKLNMQRVSVLSALPTSFSVTKQSSTSL
jgi:ABC-type microcin C transport system permease subunit YejE